MTKDGKWHILVVDDEEDMHVITRVALRTERWRGRHFHLESALSAKEAREKLADHGADIDVALVDVVMETTEAGLELCRHIRETQPPSLRLVLRTGQPGYAPIEKVMNDYDIDYYMAKPEVTKDSLYSVMRACLRSSQDIGMLLVMREQLRRSASLMEDATQLPQFLASVRDPLDFLAKKHDAAIYFVNDRSHDELTASDNLVGTAPLPPDFATIAVEAAQAGPDAWQPLQASHTYAFATVTLDARGPATSPQPAKTGVLGMLKGAFGKKVWKPEAVMGSVIARFAEAPTEKTLHDLRYDLAPFLENWRIIHRVYRWHDEAAHRRAQIDLANLAGAQGQ